MLEDLLKLLESGQDNALLRFGIGNAYLNGNDPERARAHLARAVDLDPEYSAAWKLYGKALQQCGEMELAAEVLTRGIQVASDRGDIQASKEMQVFLRRLRQEMDG